MQGSIFYSVVTLVSRIIFDFLDEQHGDSGRDDNFVGPATVIQFHEFPFSFFTPLPRLLLAFVT